MFACWYPIILQVPDRRTQTFMTLVLAWSLTSFVVCVICLVRELRVRERPPFDSLIGGQHGFI